jgi:hypothetical protein
MGVPLPMTYYKLCMRLTTFPERSCKSFRMEHGTSNNLAREYEKNEMNSFNIEERFFPQIILCFICMSYSNTITPQSQATVVK